MGVLIEGWVCFVDGNGVVGYVVYGFFGGCLLVFKVYVVLVVGVGFVVYGNFGVLVEDWYVL